MDAQQEQFYAEAEELAGYSALSLKAMSLKAYENRKNPLAMKAYSFVWQRNARNFAKAVELFGEPFTYETRIGVQPRYVVDEYLSMFAIAALNKADAAILASEWQAKTLAYWQVRDRVAELKHRTPKDKTPKVCRHCGKEM